MFGVVYLQEGERSDISQAVLTPIAKATRRSGHGYRRLTMTNAPKDVATYLGTLMKMIVTQYEHFAVVLKHTKRNLGLRHGILP